MDKRILLHVCCAPCMIYPLDKLKSQGFEVIGFFYNPNIHPYIEYRKRKDALEDLAVKFAMEMIYPEYEPSQFFQAVNLMEERIKRCPICWYQRLKATAIFAKAMNIRYFSTTLLVSPYQDIDAIKEIGLDNANNLGIEFYFDDFRKGFKSAHGEAKRLGLYSQKYCGCIYSELERCRKSEKSL